MAKIKLGKTKDSRTRKKKVVKDAEIEVLQKLRNEKEQPSFKVYLLQKGYSLQTIRSFEFPVNHYLIWLKNENVTAFSATYNDVLHYVQSRRNNVKQRTIQKEINALRHYYNHLKDIGLVKENPTLNIVTKGVKQKILYHILSKQELEKLYNDFTKKVTPEDHSNRNKNWYNASVLAKKRNKIIVSLLVYQGLNTKELGRLTTTDLKLREGKIFIGGTRRSNERTLKLESHQILDFMEYTMQVRQSILEETGKDTDLLFTSFGRSTKFKNIIHKLLQQLKKLNKKVKNVHQIRTSVIVHWLKTYNLREVQYMAGHRYVSSTEAYLINDLEDLQDDIEKYHPMI